MHSIQQGARVDLRLCKVRRRGPGLENIPELPSRWLPLKILVKSEFVTLWPWGHLSTQLGIMLLWSNVKCVSPPHPTLPHKNNQKVVCSFQERDDKQQINFTKRDLIIAIFISFSIREVADPAVDSLTQVGSPSTSNSQMQHKKMLKSVARKPPFITEAVVCILPCFGLLEANEKA